MAWPVGAVTRKNPASFSRASTGSETKTNSWTLNTGGLSAAPIVESFTRSSGDPKHFRNRQHREKLVLSDGSQPCRSDAAALGTHRLPAKLTRRDARRQIGGNAAGDLGKNAAVWAAGRMAVTIENDV